MEKACETCRYDFVGKLAVPCVSCIKAGYWEPKNDTEPGKVCICCLCSDKWASKEPIPEPPKEEGVVKDCISCKYRDIPRGGEPCDRSCRQYSCWEPEEQTSEPPKGEGNGKALC